MKKRCTLLLSLIVISIWASAQIPAIKWARGAGGSGYDYAYSSIQTKDSGYVIAGGSTSSESLFGNHGSYDAFVVKTSAAGDIEWSRSYGGGDTDVCVSIVQTFDGGFIMAASSRSNDGDVSGNHGSEDIWIVKLSPSGAIQWQRSFGGSGEDHAASIQQTADSGYFVTGYTNSADGDITATKGENDFWVLRLSKDGSMQWQRSYGGTGDDYATAGIQTSDGKYVVVGYTTSIDGNISGNHGGQDFWVIEISSSGSIAWQRAMGGSNSDFANSVVQSSDGGFVIAGGSNSVDGDILHNIGKGDGWIVKLSASGSPVWQLSVGGNKDDAINSICQTPDGGYIASGFITSEIDATFMGSTDFWLVKISATGALQWQRCMGTLGIDVATSAVPTLDSGYAIGGYSFYFGRDFGFNAGGCDYWLVKLKKQDINEVPGLLTLRSPVIAPNPATDIINISGENIANIVLYNAAGETVLHTANANYISLASLPAGIYFVQVYNKDGALLKQEKIVRQ